MDRSKTFALDVRVLLCRNCGAPNESPTGGGELRCEYCDAVNHVASRPSLNPQKVAPQPLPDGLAEQQRLSTLRTQRARYDATNNPYAFFRAPPGLESIQRKIVSQGFSDASLSQEVQAHFTQAVALCGANPYDPGAQRRCFWLARVLSQIWSAQDQFLRQRAVLETASEVLTDHGHRYIMRTSLASAARSMGDVTSADAWLAQCEANPSLLDLDSAYRVTAASLALVRQQWGLALQQVGPLPDAVPIEPASELLATVIRAAALEGAGNRTGAEQQLIYAAGAHGRDDVAHLLEVNDSVSRARETFARLQARKALPRGARRVGHTGVKLGGCFVTLLLIALIAAPVLFSPLICTGMGSCTGYHQVAMARLRACPQVVEALGEPVRASYVGFSCGNMETSGGSGYANWRMPVTGSRRSGVYEFNATASGGRWTITSGRVTVDGQTYDLANCSPPMMPGALNQPPTQVIPMIPGGQSSGSCAQMAACCQVAGANVHAQGICRSLPQLQSLGAQGEQPCAQSLSSLRQVLSATSGAVPPQCL
jgi:hypothetical protein